MSRVHALVLIKAEPDLVNELAEQLVDIPGIHEVFSVAGRWDLVAIVRARENDELADIISARVRKLRGIHSTETLIAFRVFTKAQLSKMLDLD